MKNLKSGSVGLRADTRNRNVGVRTPSPVVKGPGTRKAGGGVGFTENSFSNLTIALCALIGIGLCHPANATLSGAQRGTTKAATIPWQTSFATAQAQAKRTGKPIMAVFGGVWCVPCHTMDAKTWPDSKVVTEARHWIAVKVDADHDSATADKYKVEDYPTILFLRADGTEIIRAKGYNDAPGVLKVMKAAWGKLGH